MTATADASGTPTRASTWPTARVRRRSGPTDISRVPYLPGLDGMRAIAVVAVMVYHANADWLPGGYLGVEVFFVISGYLITLLLISEKERTETVDMKQFWVRRARRLLPALFTMMIALTIWTSLFERDALGKLRGDVIAAFFYVSNWYQIWTGAGYTAANEFAPLRHLWSLAVEEQFYVVWPLVMFALLRGGSRRIADISRWLVLAALGITIVTALVYTSGPIGTPEVTPDAYWSVFGRDISKFDWSYLGTFSRAGGLLLGAAFAMVWRPVAVMRGPLRTKGRLLDLVAIVGFLMLVAMFWWMWLIGPDGGNPFLFRGGFLLCAVATLMMVSAVTHERAATSKALSIPVLLWIGTRSYGLYLYHWPIYQVIRDIAGNHLKFYEFVFAMVLTGIVTELSYRFIETPIRKRTLGASIARIWRSPVPGPRNALIGIGAVVGAPHVVRRGQPGKRSGRGERRAPDPRRGRRVHLRRRQQPDLLGCRADRSDRSCGRGRRFDCTGRLDRSIRFCGAARGGGDDDDHDRASAPDRSVVARRLGDARCRRRTHDPWLHRRRPGEPPVLRWARHRRAVARRWTARRRRGRAPRHERRHQLRRSHRDDGRAGGGAAGAAADDRRRSFVDRREQRPHLRCGEHLFQRFGALLG